MGNPTIRTAEAKEPAPPAANGILASVGGPEIAAGAQLLPTPGPGAGSERAVTVEVPGRGPVRITYRLNSYRHRRSTHWHWVAVRAEAATPD